MPALVAGEVRRGHLGSAHVKDKVDDGSDLGSLEVLLLLVEQHPLLKRGDPPVGTPAAPTACQLIYADTLPTLTAVRIKNKRHPRSTATQAPLRSWVMDGKLQPRTASRSNASIQHRQAARPLTGRAPPATRRLSPAAAVRWPHMRSMAIIGSSPLAGVGALCPARRCLPRLVSRLCEPGAQLPPRRVARV